MLVLSILSASPKNGVEIMDEIEGATRGWWRPSPGSVYPVLEQLASEGLVKKREDGRYELTRKGESEFGDWGPFAGRRERTLSVDDMLSEIASYVSYFEELKVSKQSKLIEDKAGKIKELIERLSKVASEQS